MIPKLASFVMAAAAAGGLALAPAVFAQGPPSSSTPPAGPSVPNDHGMMNGDRMMNSERAIMMMATRWQIGMMRQLTRRTDGGGAPPSQGHNG